MSVQRFCAATTREALRQVRAALGEDALILANHAAAAGVEILALAAADAERMADVAAMGGASLGERLLHELAAVQARLDTPRAPLPVPADTALWQRLQAAGFSAALGQCLLNALPEHPPAGWLARQLALRIRVAGAAALANARAIVLLGTDAEAKAALAAHLAGADGGTNLTLVNADARRAGLREQLVAQLAARHVDLPVVNADGSLPEILAGRDAGRRVILLAPVPDAADPWTLAQLRNACGIEGAAPVLVLDAALQPEALEQQVDAHRAVLATVDARLAGVCLANCEAAPRLGPALDVLIRADLTLYAVLARHSLPPGAPGAALDVAALVERALAAAGTEAPPGPAPRIQRLLRQGRALGTALDALRQRATGFEVLERAWSGRRLAPALQEQQAEAALAVATGAAVAWCWHGTQGTGGAAQGLAGDGLPLPGVIVYALADSMLPILIAEEARMARAMHLLPAPPAGSVWSWLAAHAQPWIASARGGTRVWHAGTRQTLADCRSTARTAAAALVHLRGRGVHLSLRRAPVALDVRGAHATALLDAWFAELRDRATGAPLPARCGVLPRGLPPAVALRLVALQLTSEALPQLTVRAQRGLAALGGTLAGAATRLAADSLAALACRLDGEAAEWALEARVELHNLAGNRRGRGANGVLENLIELLATRDALREVGVAAWQATS